MDAVLINDARTSSDFVGTTFSKYQKSQVRNALLKAIRESSMEAALNWSAELICAGHLLDLWDIVFLVMSKHIHLANPKLPVYVATRYATFKKLLLESGGLELELRNHRVVRQLFAEMMGVLCFSPKKPSMEVVKIKHAEEFNVTGMAHKLQAPHVNFARPIFKPDDPTELYVAINEFVYHLSPAQHSMLNACYWLEWILAYEGMCRKKKDPCLIDPRKAVTVTDKYQTDVIWLIWDAIKHVTEEVAASSGHQSWLPKVIEALYELFLVRYSPAVKTRRRYLLYFTMSLLTEPCDPLVSLIHNKAQIEFMVKKVDLIYKALKKHEVSPDDLALERPEKPLTALEKAMNKIAMVQDADLTGI
jgi:hypothetical protein